MTQPVLDEAKIRETAYLFWLDEGQPHGRDEEHWLKAIDALTPAKPKRARKSPAKPRSPKAKAAAPAKSAAKAKTTAVKKPRTTKAAKAK